MSRYQVVRLPDGLLVEHHDTPTQAARACAILNAHNRKNGHSERYAYTPPDPAGPFELPDWAKEYAE